MGPAVKSPLPLVRPAPEDEDAVRAAFEEAERGDGVDLTPDEIERMAETGEWPERLG